MKVRITKVIAEMVVLYCYFLELKPHNGCKKEKQKGGCYSQSFGRYFHPQVLFVIFFSPKTSLMETHFHCVIYTTKTCFLCVTGSSSIHNQKWFHAYNSIIYGCKCMHISCFQHFNHLFSRILFESVLCRLGNSISEH